ncbi:MAG: BlaI/MecI/CopY family transcriptional regulator [Mariniblastus sp.]
MGKRKTKPLSSTQEEIMNIVWDRGEVTVNDVLQVISKRRTTSRTTIQTLLVRMKEKGWVKTRSVGQAFVYSAARERSVSLGHKARDLLNSCFEGSATKLMNALLEEKSLSKSEAQELRDLIAEAETKSAGKRKSKKTKSSRNKKKS